MKKNGIKEEELSGIRKVMRTKNKEVWGEREVRSGSDESLLSQMWLEARKGSIYYGIQCVLNTKMSSFC